MSDNISELVKRLCGWATDARLGRVMIGADQDIREAASALAAQAAEIERLRAVLHLLKRQASEGEAT